MNIVLWIVQGLLALLYLAIGAVKASQPIPRLSKRLPWVTALPPAQVRAIGVAEALGGIGIVLPLATGILPWLTPTAAGGLVIIQVAAAVFHTARGEYATLRGNIVLLILAAFVLFGRTVLIPA
ncbi:MAG TPA: DoxX family protein [Ktedonobacterales bacterium]|nr:DoxX family protein [Ktedonobacterales bacterium]